MNTVKFGTLDSYSDLHSILNKKTIGTPTPKKETVSVAGRDGEIDLTDYFGEVKYNNRPLNFDFTLLVKPSLFASTFSDIQDKLHGQLVKITLSDDNAYYYMGEIYIRQAKYQHADISFSTAVHTEPLVDYWWTRCGYAREMTGNYSSALEAYSKAIELNGSNSDAIRGRERVVAKLR